MIYRFGGSSVWVELLLSPGAHSQGVV